MKKEDEIPTETINQETNHEVEVDESEKNEASDPEPTNPVNKENSDKDETLKATIIIPFVHTEDDGFELKHCLRSIQKHLYDVDVNVKVIGDTKPTWLKEENWIHLDTVDMTARESKMKKMMVAIGEKDVHELIILMSDDMYLVNPVMLADIEVLKAVGDLKDAATIKLINQYPHNEKCLYDYETHTPCMMLKSQLKKMFAQIYIEDEEESNMLFASHLRSLYYNLVYKDIKPYILEWKVDGWNIPIANENPNIPLVEHLLDNKKFMNTIQNGYNETTKTLLDKMFSEPSDFENDISQE